jgi:hypothetical protein
MSSMLSSAAFQAQASLHGPGQGRPWRRSSLVIVATLAIMAGLGPARAAADPLPRLGGAVRVWAGWGDFEEFTWAYPGVDLVGTLRFGPALRGFVDVQIGYAPLDNHTFLSDGRMTRLAMSGGARLLSNGALRLSGTFALENLTFHSDAGLLVEHPGVDLLPERGGRVPALGLETCYDLRSYMAVGVFGRAALTEVTLFRDDDSGVEEHARLVLAGFFVEFRVR